MLTSMRDRRLVIIFAVVLVNMLSFSVILPLLPYLARELGASAVVMGWLSAMYPIFQFIGAPILGRLSDRFGRKPLLLVSVLGTAAGFVVLATASALPVLFLGRILDGLTGGNVSVAQAYIADITPAEKRGRALGMIGAAFGLGFILGPVTGGLLSSVSPAAPAWLGAALSLISALLIATLVPESLSAEAKAHLAGKPRRGFTLRAAIDALKTKRVGPLLTVRILIGTSFGMFEAGFSLWALSALGLDARTNAFVLAYVGLLSVLMQAFVIGRLTARYSDDGLLLFSLGAATLGLAIWGFSPSLTFLLVLMPLISFGLAVSNTISTSALTKSVHRDELGGILGLNTSIQAATRIPAPVLTGTLVQYASVWAPGLVAGAITLGAAAFAYQTLCWKPGQVACVEDFSS